MPEYRQLAERMLMLMSLRELGLRAPDFGSLCAITCFRKNLVELSKEGNAHVLHNAHSAGSNDGDKNSHTHWLL
jgi:hypothetical protein